MGRSDILGTWTTNDYIGVPIQRPADLGDRLVLTEEEFPTIRPDPPGVRDQSIVRISAPIWPPPASTSGLRNHKRILERLSLLEIVRPERQRQQYGIDAVRACQR